MSQTTRIPKHDLSRFVDAQSSVYERALAELRRGQKTSHWMWFVFPQIAGLGRSPTAQFYAIADLDEARAYLAPLPPPCCHSPSAGPLAETRAGP
jgi:uncharacterized protein (DUF1810 family)